MTSFSVVFFGTPAFAEHHLQALLDSDSFEVVGVVSQPARPSGRKLKHRKREVEVLAKSRGLPLITNLSSEGSFEELRSWGAEVAVVVAFGELLSQKILNLYPQKIVNIHASLLPRWRGAAPIQRAIMAGDKETGVTLQLVKKELDAGDILGLRKVALTTDMSAVELHDILKVLGVDLLKKELVQYLKKELKPQPQGSVGLTYAHKIKKPESAINWIHSAESIYAQFRALSLGSGVFCRRNSKILKLVKIEMLSCSKKDPEELSPSLSGAKIFRPGEIINVEKDFFTVACAEGIIKVLRVQPESKAEMEVSDFLRGNPLSQGELLE